MTSSTVDVDDVIEIDVLKEGQRQAHICATCANKQRVMVTTENGSQLAMVWRCGELTRRFSREILVEPTGSCFEAKSLTDYWSCCDRTDLVW